ncbi:MAG TPA: hypothetical protein VEP90_08480 [Methylomirabilota bacterium]|nr:hypothetical protein [Methylomirabilota bacterium]
MEQEQYTPTEATQKVNDGARILAEYEKQEAESNAARDAYARGEKIPRRPQPTVEEQLTTFRGYGIKYGQKALAELLGYEMDEKVQQMKDFGKPVDGYSAVVEQAIQKLLPDIQKNQELKKIYEEALREQKEQRNAFNKVANAPDWETLPEVEKNKRYSLLEELRKRLDKYRKQADPNFGKTS